jgi:G6PDH family F420-dependent oxidoreductase
VTRFGYTLMTEQSGPRQLVDYAARADDVGFDFLVSSDHYFPWLDEMGHAPYAWALLGAVAQTTSRAELMTYVTCPTIRYHPVVVAQKAATLGVLSGDRFLLGLGSGENLNEHVVGRGWPAVDVRQRMLAEATELIRLLLTGDQVTYHGEYFDADRARVWDLPERPVELALAVGGSDAVSRFAPLADHLIATEPEAALLRQWDEAKGDGAGSSRKIGQIPISWDRDRARGVERAHRLFRWFGGGWAVNADLPVPNGFEGATKFVTPDDVAKAIPCGPDLDAIVDAVRGYEKAGFTDVALVQIGDEQQLGFLTHLAPDLLERLRA